MGLHQTKKVLQDERHYQKNKKPITAWETIFANYISYKQVSIQNVQRTHAIQPQQKETT